MCDTTLSGVAPGVCDGKTDSTHLQPGGRGQINKIKTTHYGRALEGPLP